MEFSETDIFEFTTESLDLLDQAEASLLAIDKGADFKSHYDAIFRVFHSLKGGSGMLGLLILQNHMHQIENLLSSVKEKTNLSSEEVSYFLSSVDAARRILSGEKVQFDYNLATTTPTTTSSPAPTATPQPAIAKYNEELPLTTPTGTPPAAASSASGTTKKKSIAYIADDEQIVLDALSDLLQEGDFETRCFLNPKDLLVEARISPPDIVFTDLKMPEMTGLDLLKDLRRFNPDVPVIIVSGFVTTEALMEAVDQGIFAAVEKPFKKETLLGYALAAIREHNVLKMLRRSIKMLIYQFTDLEDFLKANGKEDLAKTARHEINQLMAQWKESTSPNKKAA